MQQYLQTIRDNNGMITTDLIKTLIEEHEPTRKELQAKYERYKASIDGVPIFSRELSQNESANKINNKLNNDFFGEIVDTKIGYFMGIPVSRSAEDGVNLEPVEEFDHRNDIEDLESELSKFATICGYAAELLYLDQDGLETVKKVKPWECIFLYEDSITAPEFALRYYLVKDVDGKDKYKVEFYNESGVFFFIEGDSGYSVTDQPLSHQFGGCPLYGIENNNELQGDADKVFSLIDAYDRSLSDVNSEIEQFRLAYMLINGMTIGDTEDEQKAFMDRLQHTGAIEVTGEEGDVRFITKNLDDSVIEHHLDRLEERIKQGAKTVDFTDESFGTSVSGVSLKYKLFNLESKCITAERKMLKAQRRRYRLLSNSWSARGVQFDHTKLTFQYTRNVFVDYAAEADALMKLAGQVSDETRFSLMSFIQNPHEEIEKLKQQREESDAYLNVNLDAVNNVKPLEGAEDGAED